MCCPAHGVAVAAVPWARHGAGFTRAFEDTCAWLAVHTSRSAVGELLRVAWRTVGRVCARVAAEQAARTDRLAGLRRIGVDEIAYKKGQPFSRPLSLPTRPLVPSRKLLRAGITQRWHHAVTDLLTTRSRQH